MSVWSITWEHISFSFTYLYVGISYVHLWISNTYVVCTLITIPTFCRHFKFTIAGISKESSWNIHWVYQCLEEFNLFLVTISSQIVGMMWKYFHFLLLLQVHKSLWSKPKHFPIVHTPRLEYYVSWYLHNSFLLVAFVHPKFVSS